jgi:predicted phosphodiesterase
MRLAVISDIHSNLEAFEAVLKDISENNADDIISLGDNIGYGSQPEEVIVNLKRHNILSVIGNHELAFLDEAYLATFNPHARKALIINKKKMSDSAKHYISNLPYCMVQYGARFVHGLPPDTIASYVFKAPEQKLIGIMGRLKQSISFVGHTHQLEIYELNQNVLKKKEFFKSIVLLAKDARYIINVGSVGQPRDGYNEAKYVIWDMVQNTMEPRFVSYDYKKAAKKIIKAGIPARFADQLENTKT